MTAETHAQLQQCRDAVDRGCAVAALTGPATRQAFLDRLALAEQVRLDTPAVAVADGPTGRLAHLVDGLVAGSTDTVSVTTEGTPE